MEKQKAILIYYNWFEDVFKELSNEEAGILIKALLDKVINNNDPEETITENRALRICYKQISSIMQMDKERYQERCEKNRIIAIERERKKREEKAIEHKVW